MIPLYLSLITSLVFTGPTAEIIPPIEKVQLSALTNEIQVEELQSSTQIGYISGIPTIESDQSKIDISDIQNKTVEKLQAQEAERIAREAKEREEAERAAQAEAARKAEIERQRVAQIAQQRAIETPSYAVRGDWESLIRARCAQVGCNSDQLIRVMYCESGGRSNAYNPSGATGLFQFMPNTFRANAVRAGIGGADIWNPESQIIVATYMFANGQAHQWVCK